MRILGIDPGPTGIAWAVFWSTVDSDIIGWGIAKNDDSFDTRYIDHIAIELPVLFARAGNPLRDTLLTTGIWIERLSIPRYLQLPRATIAGALKARGDAAINRAMRRLCPALDRDDQGSGLTSDVRAAAAVAYVASGRAR